MRNLQEDPLLVGLINSFLDWGKYLDQYLKPLVQKGKSYRRDSAQLITELQDITGA